jgi:hypothetical protein
MEAVSCTGHFTAPLDCIFQLSKIVEGMLRQQNPDLVQEIASLHALFDLLVRQSHCKTSLDSLYREAFPCLIKSQS